MSVVLSDSFSDTYLSMNRKQNIKILEDENSQKAYQ